VPFQAIGKFTNTLALFFALWGSGVLLSVASSSVDIILNSLAVLFIIKIDNEIVSEQDYLNAVIVMKNRLIYRNDAYHTKKDNMLFKAAHSVIVTLVKYTKLIR